MRRTSKGLLVDQVVRVHDQPELSMATEDCLQPVRTLWPPITDFGHSCPFRVTQDCLSPLSITALLCVWSPRTVYGHSALTWCAVFKTARTVYNHSGLFTATRDRLHRLKTVYGHPALISRFVYGHSELMSS